ncbi:MAG: winged helix DNA-binding domain-containing protein [Pyrinomonadaceae bacterium]
MGSLAIAHQRLNNQRLSSRGLKKPADVVQWLGAVQAQDYYAAKWALGQRMQDASDDDIEEAFTKGEILRTHIMRPTWHFVAPADIRWLLKLTAPRVHAANRYYYRQLELDDAVVKRCNKVITRALQGGRHLTRESLRSAIQKAGIATGSPLRVAYILHRAELDRVICSGARKGKQFTYALLEERVPKAKTLSHDEALAELTRRYFTSHGPATVQDFVWWSGLTTADAKAGLKMVQNDLLQEVIKHKTYWLSSSSANKKRISQVAYLLPAFDEYLIAYKDRSDALAPAFNQKSVVGNLGFDAPLVLGGYVVGAWKRTLTKSSVIVTVRPFAPLNGAGKQAVTSAVRRYGAFLGIKAEIRT